MDSAPAGAVLIKLSAPVSVILKAVRVRLKFAHPLQQYPMWGMTLPHTHSYSEDSHNLSSIDEAKMSHSKCLFALLTLLIFIGLLPVSVASAQEFSLQQIDKDRIDAYIQSRMQT